MDPRSLSNSGERCSGNSDSDENLKLMNRSLMFRNAEKEKINLPSQEEKSDGDGEENQRLSDDGFTVNDHCQRLKNCLSEQGSRQLCVLRSSKVTKISDCRGSGVGDEVSSGQKSVSVYRGSGWENEEREEMRFGTQFDLTF